MIKDNKLYLIRADHMLNHKRLITLENEKDIIHSIHTQLKDRDIKIQESDIKEVISDFLNYTNLNVIDAQLMANKNKL